MRYAQLFILSFLLVAALGAQPGLLTAEGVNTEKAFIEAKREALLGNVEKAIEAFQALAKTIDESVVYYELGRLYYTQEDNTEAIEQLEKAFKMDPNPVYARLLGELYLATGQNKKGAALYESLVKRFPEETEYYLQQALFLVRAQEIEDAIGVYNSLEKQTGINPDLSRRKHALYLGAGNQKKAERELTLLIDANPRNLEYRHLLAGYYASQNQAGDAKRVYQEILQIEPDDVKAQLALQDTKPGAPLGKNDELMALFSNSDVAVDLKIGKLLPLVQAVATTRDRKMADEGLALAAELRRVHPDEAKGWAVTGDLYYHSNRYAEAAEAFRKTLDLDDTVYPVWEQLLHSLYLDNQLQELRQTASDALDVYPNRPYVYFYAALAEAARLNYTEAINLMQQAEFIFSATKPAAATVARTYQEAFTALSENNFPAAAELTKEEGPFAIYLQAHQAANNGQNNRVIELLGSSDNERNTNAAQLELLGDAYLAEEQKDKANAVFLRAKAAESKSSKLASKISQTRS